MKNFINSCCNQPFGINYTDFQKDYPYTQISENDTLCLSNINCCIKKITKISVDISISSYKIIPTPIGKSLVLDAIKYITITYVDKHYNSLICTTFEVPFCFFISMNEICEKFKYICISIENIFVTVLNEHSFSISMVIFAYPVFQQKDKSPLCSNGCFYVNPSANNVKFNKTPANCRNSTYNKNSINCRNRNSTSSSNIMAIILLFIIFIGMN